VKKIASMATVIILSMLANGCSLENFAYGLTALNGGIVVLNSVDEGGCDKWYDFADPGCF